MKTPKIPAHLKTPLVLLAILLAATQYTTARAQDSSDKIKTALSELAQYHETKTITAQTSTTNYDIGPAHTAGIPQSPPTIVTDLNNIISTTVEQLNRPQAHATIDSVANYNPDTGTSTPLNQQEIIINKDDALIVTDGKYGSTGSPSAVLRKILINQFPSYFLKALWSPDTEFMQVFADPSSLKWDTRDSADATQYDLSTQCKECPNGSALRYSFIIDKQSNKLLHITKYTSAGQQKYQEIDFAYNPDNTIATIRDKRYANLKETTNLSKETLVTFLKEEPVKTPLITPDQFKESHPTIKYKSVK